MSREFKQCPNGHYYRGDNCPYCQSQQDEPNITYVTVKACPNRHAYDKYKQECPVCGSKEVIKVYECHNTSYFHVDFIVPEVMVNEKSIDRVRAVRMLVSDGNIYNYVFVDHMGKEHSFESGDDILVGTTRLKGREIMRVCDMALDNKLSILVQNVKLSNMSKYVQCPNGHYYDSEEYDNCPYCKDAKKEQRIVLPTSGSKVCPNRHAYMDMDVCPYCGEKEVVGSVDMHTGEGYHIIARSANQILKVVVDGKEYSHYDVTIGYWVWNWASRIKSNYLLEMGYGENIMIYSHTDIQFGNTHMTGKELIKMCDAIIDNQLAIIGM